LTKYSETTLKTSRNKRWTTGLKSGSLTKVAWGIVRNWLCKGRIKWNENIPYDLLNRKWLDSLVSDRRIAVLEVVEITPSNGRRDGRAGEIHGRSRSWSPYENLKLKNCEERHKKFEHGERTCHSLPESKQVALYEWMESFEWFEKRWRSRR
jgi:small nuclear ribonucleoprotein (snRNP)-like protein